MQQVAISIHLERHEARRKVGVAEWGKPGGGGGVTLRDNTDTNGCDQVGETRWGGQGSSIGVS